MKTYTRHPHIHVDRSKLMFLLRDETSTVDLGFGHLTTKITKIISLNFSKLQYIRSVSIMKFPEIPKISWKFLRKLSKIYRKLPDTPPSTHPYPPTFPMFPPPQVQVNFPRDSNLDTISGVFPTPQLKLISVIYWNFQYWIFQITEFYRIFSDFYWIYQRPTSQSY